jgi:benzoyl-CoA reductase/2-hydroxyglutaryl-CoA dehydratase subunit BcrC/BadD/HgdB
MSQAAAQIGVAMSEARSIYSDPLAVARAAKAKGARICGYIGSDVPEELIRAAGFLPIRLRGDSSKQLEHGDRYGHLAEPVTRSLLARVVDGTYDYLDALVIDRSIDAYAALFFNLRQVRLTLPEVRLPELHFFDLLHLPHLTTERYNRDRVRELADRLAQWSGCSLDEPAIGREIKCGNAQRSVLAELASLRTATPPRLSGTDALVLISCAMLMPLEDHVGVVRRVLNEADGATPIAGRRLFLTGSNHESTRLYEVLERHGFVVVGEDHDWGDRYYADPVDQGVGWLDALTDRAMFGAPAAAKYGLAERVRYVCGRVRQTGAEVVLSLNRKGDDAARWEFPDLQSALLPEGIMCERVDDLPFDATDESRMAESLASLLK